MIGQSTSKSGNRITQLPPPIEAARPSNGRHKAVTFALWLALAVIVLVIPQVVTSRYFMGLIVLAGIYSILVLGFNFALGYTGQISLGHAAFYAIGAYTSALLAVNLKLPFWVTLPSSALFAGLSGAAVGLPCLRLRGHYLALATLGLGEIVRLVLQNWIELTKGTSGIRNIPPPSFGSLVLDNNTSFFYLVVLLVALLAFVSWRVERSKFGRSFFAIREQEVAAEAVGINTTSRKVLAFAISAAYAGIAGSLYAHGTTFITPDVFSFEESVIIATMLLIGGIGSVGGALLGSVLITFLPEMLRFLKDWYMLAYGVGIVLLMLFLPSGLFGLIKKLSRNLLGNDTRAAAVGEIALAWSEPGGAALLKEQLKTLEACGAPASHFAVRTPKDGEAMPRPNIDAKLNAVPVLEVRALTKRYGGLMAVDALDMSVQKGEIRALIGPNGAGKTTVVNMISGITSPTSGDITINGVSLKGKKAHVYAQNGVTRTFQKTALFKELSVMDNVLLAQDHLGRSNILSAIAGTGTSQTEMRAMHERARTVLEMVGLWDRRDAESRSLPYGQQRILEIARALASGPKLLLVDEPAAGMNEREVKNLQRLICGIRE
ncbi:MAG: ATP-binding cassette domain-containing protein, partial [Chloroflexi bacterium]|nr:ATP-binding cassette domain-containing protein [Chloroflexota bacterium]